MTHPTCAPARPPTVPPTGDNSLKAIGDLVSLGAKATADLDAVREAYRAVACVRGLVELQMSRPRECRVPRSEVEVLAELVNAEFERRVQIAWASIDLMQAERTPSNPASPPL